MASPAMATGARLSSCWPICPNIWDVNIGDFRNDAPTSRFAPEAAQEPYITFVKQVTTKPVVGVGRFTSPDTMVSQIKRGILDMIGAARPSIADPFLPRKIEQGRTDEHPRMHRLQHLHIVQRQRRAHALHPEPDRRRGMAARLASRTYRARDERRQSAGGRWRSVRPGVRASAGSTRLPGQTRRGEERAGWARAARGGSTRPGRMEPCARLAAWPITPAGERGDLSSQPADVDRHFGVRLRQGGYRDGSRWRKDGRGRSTYLGIAGADQDHVLTPDDIMDGAQPEGPVLIFDDDHYVMGSLMAEHLRALGARRHPCHHAQHGLGIFRSSPRSKTYPGPRPTNRRRGRDGPPAYGIAPGSAEIDCIYTGERRAVPCATVVMVTSREPEEPACIET